MVIQTALTMNKQKDEGEKRTPFYLILETTSVSLACISEKTVS